MRILGLLTATVLVLCLFTYLTRQPASDLPLSDQAGNRSASQTYASAINAASGAVRNSEASKRRNFVLELRSAAGDAWGVIEPDADSVYSVDGENSEILVVTSNSMENGRCSKFAVGEYGQAAASISFTELVCRNRISRAEYRVRLDR